MRAPHLKQLEKDKVWGGSGEAWSLAVIAALGYKRADECEVARDGGAMHRWTGLRKSVVGAKVEAGWRVGVWHGAEADGGEDEGGAAILVPVPAAVASWLKAHKMRGVPSRGGCGEEVWAEAGRGGAGRVGSVRVGSGRGEASPGRRRGRRDR